MQSLIPGPPRRMMSGSRPTEEAPTVKSGDTTKIWILRAGKPEPLTVTTGLTDGRVTAISGEGLSDGLPVITHSRAAKP